MAKVFADDISLINHNSGPYVVRLRSQVDDGAPGGNGDGIVNPGESVNLPTWIKNLGNDPATGVTSTLRSLDPAAVVLDSVHYYGSIAAGDSSYTGADGYQARISDTCSNGHIVRLALTCRDASDSTWTSIFSLTIGAAVMSYDTQRVYDPPPGGNGNGSVDAGETAQFFATVTNGGLGHGYNVRAILRSGDARLQMTDSLAQYGTVPLNSSRENSSDPFVVHADTGIPHGSTLPCTLVVLADGGLRAVFPIGIEIGITLTTDPIPDNATPSHYWAYDDGDREYSQHPDFEWVELRGRGTMVTLSDDQTVTINLPTGFNWKYYGQTFNQLSICSNGWVAPGTTTLATYYNTPLPSTGMPPMVALVWDDLYPPVGGGVWYFHDAPNHRFVVEYDSVAYYSPQTSWDKYEFILYDSTVPSPTGENVIDVQYLTANNYISTTVGIQDPTATIAIQCLFEGTYHRGAALLAANRAIRYIAGTPLTGIAQSDVNPTAAKVSVFPNPFAGRLNLVVPVLGGQTISAGIYDNTGRFVRKLSTPQHPTLGAQSLTWDARDARGARVAPGIYFYRVMTGNQEYTGKVILAR
jgi:hypothetical protein